MTLICPNEGKKMTPDHVLRIYTYMYFHTAFLQPEGCSYVIFSVLGFGARFCRARRREKRHRSHLPIQPWGKTREYKTYLDRSSPLGEIFPRSQPPPSSEARPKMTISSPYRASTASSCVFHSTLGPLLLTSHCHCTVCRCRPRRRCVHRSC